MINLLNHEQKTVKKPTAALLGKKILVSSVLQSNNKMSDASFWKINSLSINKKKKGYYSFVENK